MNPAYICYVGDKNPKQRFDLRGLILDDAPYGDLFVKYDDITDFLYAERDGKRYPIKLDYSR